MRWLVFPIVVAINLQAQWIDFTPPGTPRTPNGKPNLSAAAPRTADGKPDLNGVWVTASPPAGENERLFPAAVAQSVPGDDIRDFSKYFVNILTDFKDSPMLPATKAAFEQNSRSPTNNPSTTCLPQGVLRAELGLPPIKILQTAKQIAILHEIDFTFRQIYMDGRKLPVEPIPSWLGYSVARWQGDTLIIDSAGFNSRSWLDAMGHPHSEAMKVEERLHRRDFGHLDMTITVTDPTMYSQPITVKITKLLIPSGEVFEFVCNENEKDVAHLAKK